MQDASRRGLARGGMRMLVADATRLVRPAIAFGISFYVVLTIVALQYPTLRPAGEPATTFLGISVLGLANAATFLVIAVLFLWKRVVVKGRFYRLVIGIALALGIALGQFADMALGIGPTVALAAGGVADVLVGSATACLAVEWVRVLASLSSRQAAVNVVAAVLAAVPLLLISGIVEEFIALWGLVVAEACVVLLWRCSADGARMLKSGLKSKIHVPWKLAVTIALQGMSTGAVHAAVVLSRGDAFLPVEALGVALAGIVAFAGLLALRLDFNHLLYMVGFPLMACGQMLLVLFDGGMVGTVVHETGYRFIMVLSWVLAAWVIKHNDLSANWVWPCFMCSFVFGRIAGSSFGMLPEGLLAVPPGAAVSIVMTFALLLGALLLFGSVNLETGWDMAFVEPVSSAGTARSAFDRAVEMVACDYRLTPRETEVFGQLARGRNQEYISEHLHVSKDTVKTHRKSVYRKLDIHSQQDLVSLVERAEESLGTGEGDRAAHIVT